MLASIARATMGIHRPVTSSKGLDTVQKRFASKAAAGKTKNGRDSAPKYLGLKRASGQFVKAGNILIRQRGNKYHPGVNVGQGNDFTLYAREPGYMTFSKVMYPVNPSKRSNGRQWKRTYVNVVPENPHQCVKQDIR